MPKFIPKPLLKDIDWLLTIKLNASSPLSPSIKVSGNHDRYPAYEIIVITSLGDFVDVYRRVPDEGDRPGPDSLTSFVNVDAERNID